MDTIEHSGTGAHEIVTLQVGNYSNFVGAHFFNLQDPAFKEQNQDEFDPNILWRETRGFGNSRVFRPRVVIIDLKENLTNFFISDDSQNAATSKATLEKKTQQAQAFWDGKIEHIFTDGEGNPQQSAKKVKRLDDRVNCSWGDYARWTSDTSQQFTIPNFAHNDEKGMLSTYSQGLDIWKDMEEDVWDGIRRYAEDCDHLQGFHLLVDADDGFTGIAAGLLQNLADEYDRKSCLGFGISPPVPVGVTDEGDNKGYRRRLSNTSLLWNAFNHHSTVFTALSLCGNICSPNPTPRNLPFLKYSAESAYSSSSIIAATLDTLVSSYRVENSSILLPELTSFLGRYGRKMTTVGVSLPFPLNIGSHTLFETLQKTSLDSHWSLTPGEKPDLEKSTGNYFVLRGIPPHRTISDQEIKSLRGGPQIKNPETCFEIFARDSYSGSLNTVRNILAPVTICHPFPSIFEESVVEKYNVGKRFSAGNPEPMWQLPTISSAHNNPETGNLIEKLVGEASGGRSGSTKITADFVSSDLNMEFDDYLQCFTDLSTLRDSYKGYFEST